MAWMEYAVQSTWERNSSMIELNWFDESYNNYGIRGASTQPYMESDKFREIGAHSVSQQAVTSEHKYNYMLGMF